MRPRDGTKLRNVHKAMTNIKYAIMHLELSGEQAPLKEIRHTLIDAWKTLNEEAVPMLGGTTQKRSNGNGKD